MQDRKKRTELIHVIALVALSTALGIVFLSLGYIIPGIELTFALIIPLLASLTVISGGYKGALLLLAVSVPVSFLDFPNGIFEYLPNIAIGVIYGLARKYVPSSLLSFFLLITFSFLINYAMIYPINFLCSTDLEKVFATLLALEQNEFHPFFPSFFFLLSIGQSSLTFILSENEFHRFRYRFQNNETADLLTYLVFLFLSVLLTVLGYFFLKSLMYLGFSSLLLLSVTALILNFITGNIVLTVFEICLPFIGLILFFILFFTLKGEARLFSLLPFILICQLDSFLMLKLKRRFTESEKTEPADLLQNYKGDNKNE